IDTKAPRTYKLYTEDKKLRDEWHDAIQEAISLKNQKESKKELLPTIAQSDRDFTAEVHDATKVEKVEEESSQGKDTTKTDETTVTAPVDPKPTKTDPEPSTKAETVPSDTTASS
ncbi:15402_t:CDS:2, partial [Entrophospora sp. SA101]